MASNEMPKLNRALIFQVYGSLGAYEAGIFKTLYENLFENEKYNDGNNGPLFDILTGTGMGAVNAALIVSHVIQNGTWKGSSEKLLAFWSQVSTKSTEGLDNGEKNKNLYTEKATPEEVRRNIAAEKSLKGETPEVSAAYVKADIKFPKNKWQQFDLSPLKKTIEEYVKFPIASTFERGEPRLLLVSVDVMDGVAVTFDSYEKEHGTRYSMYGTKGHEHILQYDNGIRVEHVMACLSYPLLYPYEKISNRAFWTGGILSNSLLRELINQYKAFWSTRIGPQTLKKVIWSGQEISQIVPDIEVYIVDLWSSKPIDVPNNLGEVTNRLTDIMYHGKLKFDEQIAMIVTDYVSLCKRLIGLAMKMGVSRPVLEDILNIEANSKFRNGESRLYIDLVKDAFSIHNYNIKRIERKEYLTSVSNQWADFTSDTLIALIKEGERDAAHDLMSGMDRTLEIIDEVSAQIQGKSKNSVEKSYSVEQGGNKINLRSQGEIVQTITAGDLNKLSPDDQAEIKTYEEAMYNRFKLWKIVYPQIPLQSDPMAKAQLQERLEDLKKNMCEDFKNISNYLIMVGIDIGDKHRPIRFLCQQAKEPL